MLNVAKLALLMRYQWNARQFAAQASAPEKELMRDIDWDELAELLQDLRRYHQRLVSPAYAATIHANLLAACADEETAQTFLGYASTG